MNEEFVISSRKRDLYGIDYYVDHYLLIALSCRFNCQYFSGNYTNTGTDTCFCSENRCCIIGLDFFWPMDVKSYNFIIRLKYLII